MDIFPRNFILCIFLHPCAGAPLALRICNCCSHGTELPHKAARCAELLAWSCYARSAWMWTPDAAPLWMPLHTRPLDRHAFQICEVFFCCTCSCCASSAVMWSPFRSSTSDTSARKRSAASCAAAAAAAAALHTHLSVTTCSYTLNPKKDRNREQHHQAASLQHVSTCRAEPHSTHCGLPISQPPGAVSAFGFQLRRCRLAAAWRIWTPSCQ